MQTQQPKEKVVKLCKDFNLEKETSETSLNKLMMMITDDKEQVKVLEKVLKIR